MLSNSYSLKIIRKILCWINSVTHLEFSSSIIFLILLLALSDFSALAQAGCRAEDLISSSCNWCKGRWNLLINLSFELHNQCQLSQLLYQIHHIHILSEYCILSSLLQRCSLGSSQTPSPWAQRMSARVPTFWAILFSRVFKWMA